MKNLCRALALFLAGLTLAACADIRPVPATLNPEEYTAISYERLLKPDATLRDGDKVRVEAYFWQYLDYDPALVRNYLTMARHPIAWPKLDWFALYGSEDMKGYYDRATIDAALRPRYPLHRLDHVMVYGELDSLGAGGYYLHVHHIDSITED